MVDYAKEVTKLRSEISTLRSVVRSLSYVIINRHCPHNCEKCTLSYHCSDSESDSEENVEFTQYN